MSLGHSLYLKALAAQPGALHLLTVVYREGAARLAVALLRRAVGGNELELHAGVTAAQPGQQAGDAHARGVAAVTLQVELLERDLEPQ